MANVSEEIKQFDGRYGFSIEDRSDNEIIFTCRDHGDMENEEPGHLDIQNAKTLWKEIKEKYPDLYTANMEAVDEWVYLTVRKK